MFKVILTLIACAIATSTLCLTIVLLSQTLDPFWALFLFPFSVFGILFTVDWILLHE